MIRYRSGYKYQLFEPASFELSAEFRPYAVKSDFIDLRDGILTISKGYAWDGPSGPALDTRNAMQGSLVHDALYQLMRENQIPRSLKTEADNALYHQCRADGMAKIRAKLWRRAVHRFGRPATKVEKKILEAP